jgi:hypothetical protein
MCVGGGGGAFWHMLSVFEICFKQKFKYQKIPTKNFTHRSRHSMFSQSCFMRKQFFFVLCVTKTNFDSKIGVAQDIFCLFTQDTKMSVFHENLTRAHRMSRCTC